MGQTPLPQGPGAIGATASADPSDQCWSTVAHQGIAFADGAFTIEGTDRGGSIAEVTRLAFDRARLPRDMDIGLTAQVVSAPAEANFPNGCHVCEVEIDPETGVTRIVGYWAVEDVGKVLNPLVVER